MTYNKKPRMTLCDIARYDVERYDVARRIAIYVVQQDTPRNMI